MVKLLFLLHVHQGEGRENASHRILFLSYHKREEEKKKKSTCVHVCVPLCRPGFHDAASDKHSSQTFT